MGQSFQTEYGYDKMMVNGKTYQGSTGPSSVVVTSGISWTSDFTVTKNGWKLCQDTGTQACDETLVGDGSGYRGCQDKTRSGKTCQSWASQTPHAHSNTPSSKPGKGLGNHNSCRNPDGESTIWCYTTSASVRWEYCDPKQGL